MKRLLMIIILGIMMFMNALSASAKDVYVVPTSYSERKTENFLRKHKKDIVCVVVQGKRVKRNGDGVDKNGFYIKYKKGKVGTRYTTVLVYKPGTTYWDDWFERQDFRGTLSVKKALRKANIIQ